MSIVEQVSTLMANQPTNEQQRISDLERQVAALTEKNAVMHEEYSKYVFALDKISQLENDNAALTKQRDKYQHSMQVELLAKLNAQEQITALTKERELLFKQIAHYCSHLTAAQEQITTLTNRATNAENETSIYKDENERYQAQLVAAQAVNARLLRLLAEVRGCFTAAIAEGLQDRLSEESNTAIGSLHDLVMRRLLHADSFAETALAIPSDTTALQARLKEERERIAQFTQTHGYATLADDIRSLA